MNIKAATASLYNTSTAKAKEGQQVPKAVPAYSPSGGEKVDRITISTEGSNKRDAAKITKDIMKEIVEMDSPSRLQEIKKLIDSGEYRVSASDVTDAILK